MFSCSKLREMKKFSVACVGSLVRLGWSQLVGWLVGMEGCGSIACLEIVSVVCSIMAKAGRYKAVASLLLAVALQIQAVTRLLLAVALQILAATRPILAVTKLLQY